MWKDNISCVLIQGELQHDFSHQNGPAAGNQRNPHLREAIKQNTTCDSLADEGENMKILDDAKLFANIVKKCPTSTTYEDLYHRELIGSVVAGGIAAKISAHPTTCILDGQYRAVTRNQPVLGETLQIQRFDKESSDPYKGGLQKDYTNKQIFQMFRGAEREPDDTTIHVFFVIDTGGKSVEYLMKNGWDYNPAQYTHLLGHLNGGSDIKIVGNNVISPETSGDSAFKKKADSTLYNNTYNKFYVPVKDPHSGQVIVDRQKMALNKRVNFLCNSLLMYQAHEIKATTAIKSSDFLSKYEISLGFLPYNYMVRQDWNLPAGSSGPSFATTDSKVDMNKVTIRKWLEAERADPPNRSDYLGVSQSGAKLKKTSVPPDWTNEEKETVSLKFQNKRSGDYLQVLMARELFGFRDYLLKVRAEESCDYTETYKNFTKEKFQKNTFFVTIDWPAAAFSIYNKVNTIVYYAGSSGVGGCILVFTFPEHEQGGGAAGIGRMMEVMGDISSSLFAKNKKITGKYSRVKNRTKRNTGRRNSRESKSSRNSRESKSSRNSKGGKSSRNSKGSKSSRNSKGSKSSRNSKKSKSRRSIKKSKSSIAETEIISPHYMVSRGDKKTMRYFTANRPCHWLFSLVMQDKIRKIKSEAESIKSLTELKQYAIRSGVLEENIRDISSTKNQRDEIIKLIIALTPIALKEEQKGMKGGSVAAVPLAAREQMLILPEPTYFGSNVINDFWTVIIFIMEDMRLLPDKYLYLEGDILSEFPGVVPGRCYDIKKFPINYEEEHDAELLALSVAGEEEGGEESSYLNFLTYVFGRFKDCFDFPVNIYNLNSPDDVRVETVSDEDKLYLDRLIRWCGNAPDVARSMSIRAERRIHYKCVWPDPKSYQEMRTNINNTYLYIKQIFKGIAERSLTVARTSSGSDRVAQLQERGLLLGRALQAVSSDIFDLWLNCVNNGFGWLSSLKQNLDQSWEMIDRLTLEIVLYKYLYTELLNKGGLLNLLPNFSTSREAARAHPRPQMRVQLVKEIFKLITEDNPSLSDGNIEDIVSRPPTTEESEGGRVRSTRSTTRSKGPFGK